VPGPAPQSKLTAGALLAALGDWRVDGRPAFRSLAAAIVDAVDRGDLPAGALLPPERRLAEMIGLSRNTVVAAYEVLRSNGVVLRRQGSGTWLPTNGVPREPWTHDHDAGLRARRLAARVVSPLDGVVDLGISTLDEPWGLPAMTLDPEELVGHGYQPHGIPALRDAIAARYTAAGWPTTAAEITITHGSQHGIALASRMLVHSGDVVAVESPTYPGAIDVLARDGARFATVPLDGGGARVDRLARIADEQELRLAYLVPTCHNPAGMVLPSSRRREVAAIVDAHPDLWLLEDETLAALRFDGDADAGRLAPPPIASLLHGDRFIVVGSFAKVVWGGLRVGWIRASASTIARIGRLRAALDLGGSAVAQLVALRCVDNDLTALRSTLAGRAAFLAARIREELPEWRFVDPAGGLSLWCQLPFGTGDDLAAAGLAHGVSVLPGSAASVDEVHLDHIRISFGHPEDVLDAAVARLAKAWRSL
jgi:DNA-binding transcriptional MocR family regulator